MDQDVLIDSNIYIDLLRTGRDPAQAIFNRYDDLDVITCGMVQLEVLRGIKVPKAKGRMERIFSLMQFVPSDNSLWEEAIKLAWNLDRRGNTIPAQDILIAVTALRVDAAVHTYDKHFLHVPGLNVVSDPL